MDIRTFEARTMKEALARVRSELGPEAVILQSREVKRRRLLGLARSHAIEITAGTGLAIAEKPAGESAGGRAATIEQVQAQLEAVHGLVEDLCRRKKSPTPDLPPPLVSVYTSLIDRDVHESIASGLVCQLRDDMSRLELSDRSRVATRLRELVRGCLNVTGPIVCETGRCKIVALAGPTGAGKTATIAKLAANFKLRQRLRVGLVSVDTYRIAAVEQLRTYSEIIDVPFKVAASPREMAAVLSEMGTVDLVLVDTVGRSPRDEIRINELKTYLNEAGNCEVHLVLAAGSSSHSLLAATQRFGAIGATRLLFTKLDEATTLGGVLTCAARSGNPVSYLTTGQDVPDNIEIADSDELASRIVDSVLCDASELRRAA
jgi:flagellar biosynthesis protein FlhF